MDNYNIIQRGIHHMKESLVPVLANYRRSKLNNTDFTIISNNCWAGKCYEYYGIKKLTPTIGMYFFADDYIKYISGLEKYAEKDIEIVEATESIHYKELLKRKQESVPVGRLDDDVEVIFLHYPDPRIAKDKWMRRNKRINYNNLIFKFSYMNQCNDDHIIQFEKISRERGVKHFEFVSHSFPMYENAIVIKPFESNQIGNDTFYWNKYFDVTSFINT